MSAYLKSLIIASRGFQKTQTLQVSLAFKPQFFTSYENKNILKEVNKENRELYTREQKKKIQEEESEKDIKTNFRDEDYEDRFIQENNSGYFSREMDNYFKTLNGNRNMNQNDVAEDEDEIIKRRHY